MGDAGIPRPHPERRETFPKACRILRRGDFLRVQGQQLRIHGKRLILQFANPPQSQAGVILESRLGLTVSKKVGGSVLRNRLKRWLREAFRRAPPELRPQREPRATTAPGHPGSLGAPPDGTRPAVEPELDRLPYDLVVTVKRGVDDFSYTALRDELLNGIARYLQTRQTRPARSGGTKQRGPPGGKPGAARRGRGDGGGDAEAVAGGPGEVHPQRGRGREDGR